MTRGAGGWLIAALLAAVAVIAAAWTLCLADERGRVALRDLQRTRSPAPVAAPDPTCSGRLALPDRAGTPQEVRGVVHACRNATVADVAELREAALESADPLVAGNAVRALGRLEAFAGAEELRALLDDPRPRVRQEAVRALGKSGGPGALELLLEQLQSCESELAPLVLASLGELGDRRARAAVARAAFDPERSPAERAFGRTALRRLEPVRSP